MTVYIEKPAVNLREELASLRNQGGYEEQQFYFDGLVTNGTFDADTDWTKGTSAVIANGYLEQPAGTGSYSYQSFSTEAGKTYQVKFDILQGSFFSGVFSSPPAGTVLSGTSATRTAGSYTISFVADDASAGFSFTSVTGDARMDNVSVFETDGTDVVHRMPKGWVPLHVYEDGLLQREGAAHDYEVVYDGFDYYVKPAVAPGATTQTCVIGVRK